ncbi:thioredoxin family protein [Stieleria varia]|uniref:Thioredoxin n=1 Tax=Stieleria varia TaxID=2528005 RepID=A0A5C6B202_9BACT|nr:thioredoxin family protein [Stieleria varia]TWU06345.1 Thioredoxin [Stieleria varia]
MLSLLMAIMLTGVTSEQIKTDYATAYKESVAQDKPLLVVVGAPWCPACNALKQTTIQPMAQTGELDNVSVVLLDRDTEPALVNQLTKGEKMLPQIIMFTKSSAGKWERQRLMGYQPKQPVRNLIRKAVTLGQG